MKTADDLHTLQTKLIYAMVVAGKSARFANEACHRFFRSLPLDKLPFTWIRGMQPGELMSKLREARTGKYEKLCQGLQELVQANIDLRTCGPEALECIHGIGPKTARFWLLWTRPGANYAALDVHVLRWMRAKGYAAPTQTPASPKVYARLEEAFLEEARRRGLTPRELDIKIWEAKSSAPNIV